MRSFATLLIGTLFAAVAAMSGPSCDADLAEGCVGGVCGGAGLLGVGGLGGFGGSSYACHPEMEYPDDIGATGTYPCDVEAVILTKCMFCHDDPPTIGPWPLITYDYAHGPYNGVSTTPRWKRMCCAIDINCKECQLRMPFGDAPQLTAAELATLFAWCDAGAPSAPPGTVCP